MGIARPSVDRDMHLLQTWLEAGDSVQDGLPQQLTVFTGLCGKGAEIRQAPVDHAGCIANVVRERQAGTSVQQMIQVPRQRGAQTGRIKW